MVLSQFLEMGSSRLLLVVEDKMAFFCLVGGHKILNQTMTYGVHLSVSVFSFISIRPFRMHVSRM
jgi:hypothetical protein